LVDDEPPEEESPEEEEDDDEDEESDFVVDSLFVPESDVDSEEPDSAFGLAPLALALESDRLSFR